MTQAAPPAAAADSDAAASAAAVPPLLVFGVLALALSLRMLHWSSAVQSPLSYQPGPDEDYYLRFGAAVASGHGQDAPEFTFMDPGYGYLLGAVFKVLGVNRFAVYLLQALLDTATTYAIFRIGRSLGRPRAGLYGAVLYAFTSTAIMFCATLLKETCVAAYLTWWVVAALAVHRRDRVAAWFAFGVLCGVGVALRSTLMALAVPALLLPLLAPRPAGAASAAVWSPAGWGRKSGPLLAGLALTLAPWCVRNEAAYASLSPLPHNGGIVLQQIYNPQNPESAIWVPPFVSYLNPSEIWRGYAAEASRRAGFALSPPRVDAYWRAEALNFIRTHPADVMSDVFHKGVKFLSATEIPNNRSAVEERMFSPVLGALPPLVSVLLGLGLAGLVWFATQDRRWLILATPIALSWATMALFWAEDRFRFHAEPVLALCAGLMIDLTLRRIRQARGWPLPVFGALAVLVTGSAVLLGRHYPPPAVQWDHIVWGYIKMGKPQSAEELAGRIVRARPDDAPVLEALGYLAATQRRYDAAAAYYQRALVIRPGSYLAHFDLAKVYMALGARPEAAEEARRAMELSPSAETQALLTLALTPP